MTVPERLAVAAEALVDYNPHSLEAIDDMGPEDLVKISADFGLKDSDYPKLIGTMIYIRKRLVEKKSRLDSFKASFPERCIATEHVQDTSTYGAVTAIGDELTKTTINVKARRLENSQLYIHVYQMLQSNLYINYAMDRLAVLDEALAISMDSMVPTRDRDRYMKIFLDATEKPKDAKALEFNLNLTQNNISVTQVEDRLGSIADTMKGYTAGQLVEIMHTQKEKDD